MAPRGRALSHDWVACGHPQVGQVSLAIRALDGPPNSGWIGGAATLYGDWTIVHGVKSGLSARSLRNAHQAVS